MEDRTAHCCCAILCRLLLNRCYCHCKGRMSAPLELGGAGWLDEMARVLHRSAVSRNFRFASLAWSIGILFFSSSTKFTLTEKEPVHANDNGCVLSVPIQPHLAHDPVYNQSGNQTQNSSQGQTSRNLKNKLRKWDARRGAPGRMQYCAEWQLRRLQQTLFGSF
jgi:hypothetical protein